MLQYFRLDSVVQPGDLENRNEVIDELSGSHFNQEVISPVLDTCVCELRVEVRYTCPGTRGRTYTKGEDLYVRVLVVETALESAHGFLCWGRL